MNYKLVNTSIITDKELKKIIKDFDISPFTTNNIVKELKKIKDVKHYIYEFDLIPNTHFHLITNVKNKKKILDYYFYVLKLKQTINEGIFPRDVYIYILPTNINKKLKKVVTPNEVNSGATNIIREYCGGSIYVWRKQELIKVLVHETLHSVHYDKSIYEQSYNIFENMRNLNLNEIYNEFGALYIMAMKSGKNINEILNKQLKLDKENICRIMRINKMERIKDFLNPNKYKQKASIFSYIVLKCLLLDVLLQTNNQKCLDDFFKLGFYKGIDNTFQPLLLKIFQKYQDDNFNDFCKKNKEDNLLKFSIF